VTASFDEAWARAQSLAKYLAAEGLDVVVLRDVLGRVALVLDDPKDTMSQDRLASLQERLRTEAGAFASPSSWCWPKTCSPLN
jgi:hypothetical protein